MRKREGERKREREAVCVSECVNVSEIEDEREIVRKNGSESEKEVSVGGKE